ncbi:hypothetical protein H6758_04070 [Candidatus Nomurabacteria bacterium]|nr:hypothetical protein [Candidatus Nomurabacteria bacterium]
MLHVRPLRAQVLRKLAKRRAVVQCHKQKLLHQDQALKQEETHGVDRVPVRGQIFSSDQMPDIKETLHEAIVQITLPVAGEKGEVVVFQS